VVADIRPIRADEYDEFLRVDATAFQFEHKKTDPPRPDTWARGELDRAFGAFIDGLMVGIGRNYSFDVTVPGGERLLAGAVSWIGVLPTHRRRGVLTAMMAALAEDSIARGEPLSMLTASEGAIYRRFGYGVAVDRVGCTIESAHGSFGAFVDRGSVRFVTADQASLEFPSIYEATRSTVGSVPRPEFWWPEVLFGHESENRFYVVHETDGVPDGFVAYSVVGDWVGGINDRTLEVLDLQATNDPARLALWRFLLDVDLTVRVKCFQVPLHDPLRWALVDVRRRRVDFVNDGLWLKLLDVPAALTARSYEVDESLRFAVDGVTYELTASAGSGSCMPTADGPEVSFTREVLGSLYLGQRRASEFVATGGCTGPPPAIARADRLFATLDRAATLSYF
jgi:predicted acetyltransferase